MEKNAGPGHQGEYFAWFDFLRITLAVGVFASHVGVEPFGTGHFGNACVQVFFALSGFLIGGILAKSSPADLPRFYFNRSTRIWVPYAIAIALLFAGTALKQDLSDPKLWEFFFYKATFTYNTFGLDQLGTYAQRMPLQGTGSHFWSICVEEQFYLVAPFVIVLLRDRRLASYLILVGLLVLNFFHPHHYAAVALGVLLALSREAKGEWYLTPRGMAIAALTLVAAVVLGVAGVLAYGAAVPYVAVALVALLARPHRRIAVGAWLGGLSYPFYLNHWVGLFFQKRLAALLHTGRFLTALGAFAIAFGVSAVHYRFIDSQVLRHRNRWFSTRLGIAACASGILLVVVGLVGGLTVYRHH